MASDQTPDLKTLCNIFARVQHKIFKIGIQLGIPENKVKELLKEEDPVTAVVKYWLNGDILDAPITWDYLVGVLRSYHVGEPGLAMDIEKKYCLKELSLCQRGTGEQAIDSTKFTYGLPADSFVSCELQFKNFDGEESTGRGLVQCKHDHFEISFNPTASGLYRANLSEFRGIIARPPNEEIGKVIWQITELNAPVGVAITSKNEVVVTEWQTEHCVSMFYPSGEKIRSFGERGSGAGKFQNPRAVAIDREGNILVVDNENHRIQKFTEEGKFLAEVGSQGAGPLNFNFPNCVACNPFNGNLYIACGNHCIQILEPDFSHLKTFGGAGEGIGQFNSPQHIAFDRSGNVYIADRGNDRIQVFTANGEFLKVFGEPGVDIKAPFGIAIDCNDERLYVTVSDKVNQCVFVFSLNGKFKKSFGKKGEGKGEFKCIRDVTIDKNGVLYVCDSSLHRVQIF